MKNSNDIIGNGTRDLPVCSVVPQPSRRNDVQYSKYYSSILIVIKWKRN